MRDRELFDLLNILIFGSPRVGKSYLQRVLCNQTQQESTEKNELACQTIQVSGLNIRFQVRICNSPSIEDLQVNFQDIKVMLFVYDATDLKSFYDLKFWIREAEICASEDTKKILVGNKSDVEEKLVTTAMGKDLALLENIKFLDVSAKTGHNISQLISIITEDTIREFSKQKLLENEDRPKKKRSKILRKMTLRTPSRESDVLSSSDLRSIKAICIPTNDILLQTFASFLVTAQNNSTNKGIILREFSKEWKTLFASDNRSVMNETLKALRSIANDHSDNQANFTHFLQTNTVFEFLERLTVIPDFTFECLKLFNKIASNKKTQDILITSLADNSQLFQYLSNFFSEGAKAIKETSTKNEILDFNSLIDTLILIEEGAKYAEVTNSVSWKSVLSMVSSPLEHVSLRIARLIEVIARMQSQSRKTHFTNDGIESMLNSICKLIDNLNLIASPIQARKYLNVFTAFVAVLQHLKDETCKRYTKYIEIFTAVSVNKKFRSLMLKPWVGGLIAVQKFIVPLWKTIGQIVNIIPVNDLEFSKILYKSSYTKHYQGYWNTNGESKEVSIKVIDTNSSSFKFCEANFRKELLLLHYIKHRTILPFYGGCFKEENYYLVTEFQPQSLTNLIANLNKQNNFLSEDNVATIALDIVTAVKTLHEIGVVHGDLTTDNILVDKDYSSKISNFSCLSIYQSEISSNCILNLAADWSEILYTFDDDKTQFKKVSDDAFKEIMNLGFIFWELWKLLHHPLHEQPIPVDKDVLPNISNVPEGWKRLFQGCWAPTESRFTISQTVHQLGLIFGRDTSISRTTKSQNASPMKSINRLSVSASFGAIKFANIMALGNESADTTSSDDQTNSDTDKLNRSKLESNDIADEEELLYVKGMLISKEKSLKILEASLERKEKLLKRRVTVLNKQKKLLLDQCNLLSSTFGEIKEIID